MVPQEHEVNWARCRNISSSNHLLNPQTPHLDGFRLQGDLSPEAKTASLSVGMLGRYQDPAWAKRGDGTCLLAETMYIVRPGWLDNDINPQLSVKRDEPGLILTAGGCFACGSAAPSARPRRHWWRKICLIGVNCRLRVLFQSSGSSVRVVRIRDAGVVRLLLL